jgi:hypothetical protein
MDVEIIPPGRPGEISGFTVRMRDLPNGEQELISVSVPSDIDVLVLQRPAHRYQPQLVEALRRNGVAVVVDMDDDMSHIHKENIAYATYHPRSNSPFSWKYAMDSCKAATFVTTSTTELQKVYARRGHGMALDNYVPEATLRYAKPETGAFGWAGTTKSHPDDLQVCGKTVQRLIDEGREFKVIGGPSKVKEALRLQEHPPCTGSVTLDVWVKTIAHHLDVGMVPLSPSPFNTSKSRLKGIEMMAAGVAWVASPRAEYRRLRRESGCGYLAETPKDWYNRLNQLLKDEPLRKEQVEMGREYMKDQTYEANAWRWAEAWERAYKVQRGVTA